MTTRAKNNIRKPIQKLNLHTHLSSPPNLEPTSMTHALKDHNWRRAMSEEYDALVRNGTWELVPPDGITNLVGCKWIFRIKRHSDGSLDRFKARIVAKGFHQRPGVDYHETFSPVVKPTTVRLVLSIAVSNGWSLRQLDINNAFLQGRLSEHVYMAQPPGFVDSDCPTYVCKLHKAIYGLKQAPRAWYYELRQFLVHSGFTNSHSDTSLFVLNTGRHVLFLLVYVDDIIVTGNSDDLVSQFVDCLAQRFSLKDLGSLSYFLGVEVVPHRRGILLSQRRYIQDLLKRTHMADATPVLTPLPTNSSSLTITSGTPLSDPSQFRAVVGSLQYLSLTRPDISFAVNKMAQFMHQPTDEHWVLVKRILRYLCGTLDKGLLLHRESPLSLHGFSDALHAFSDADWAGNKDDYSSTSAYLVYLGRNLISWSSKKQQTVARSSTEAEYRSVAATAAELRWVCSLLAELGVTLQSSPVVYCDNIGATQLSSNPVFHSRMKHVAVDYHFIREQVQSGLLRVAHVSSADQLADLLTKPLPRSQFLLLRDKIGLFTRGLS
ncbi:retrovirus-related pol polyprotein from transposon RE2 [Citrus sinensis]|nr:retrovirus-related pol polyprotein from transposon RE2 [Citrus sinensis]